MLNCSRAVMRLRGLWILSSTIQGAINYAYTPPGIICKRQFIQRSGISGKWPGGSNYNDVVNREVSPTVFQTADAQLRFDPFNPALCGGSYKKPIRGHQDKF